MEHRQISLKVTEEGERLDRYLVFHVESLSREKVKNLIKAGQVLVNGAKAKPSHKLQINDQLVVNLPTKLSEDIFEIKAETMPLAIVYEDSELIIVNKVQGMLVHPSRVEDKTCLVNGLLAHVQKQGEQLAKGSAVYRPGIVHRLDKDTSGLLIVAKTDQAYEKLSLQMKNREVSRVYYALVYGNLHQKQLTLTGPIKRQEKNRLAYEVNVDGREAITHIKVLEQYIRHSLLECCLETGRTHQIRVHLSTLGYPIVDDPLYAKDHLQEFFNQKGQCLHAGKISFTHPLSGERLTFEAPLPDNFRQILAYIRTETS